MPGVCDLDGSKLEQRSDDVGEAVQRRLDIFFSETIQLLNYYGGQHKLVEVNGDQEIDAVQKELLEKIENARAS